MKPSLRKGAIQGKARPSEWLRPEEQGRVVQSEAGDVKATPKTLNFYGTKG